MVDKILGTYVNGEGDKIEIVGVALDLFTKEKRVLFLSTKEEEIYFCDKKSVRQKVLKGYKKIT